MDHRGVATEEVPDLQTGERLLKKFSGKMRRDMIFGILKNPIIKDVLIIVYYYQSRIFFNVH